MTYLAYIDARHFVDGSKTVIFKNDVEVRIGFTRQVFGNFKFLCSLRIRHNNEKVSPSYIKVYMDTDAHNMNHRNKKSENVLETIFNDECFTINLSNEFTKNNMTLEFEFKNEKYMIVAGRFKEYFIDNQFSESEEEYMKEDVRSIDDLCKQARKKLLLNSSYGLCASSSDIKSIANNIHRFCVSRPDIQISDVQIDRVIFSGRKTIIIYKDGTKSYATLQNGENFDPEKGIMVALLNKLLGKKKFHDILNKYTDQYYDDYNIHSITLFDQLLKEVLKQEMDVLNNNDSK